MPKLPIQRTTLAGILVVTVALAAALLALVDTDPTTEPQWPSVMAAVLAGFGLTAACDK